MNEWEQAKALMDKILVDISDIGFAIEFAKIWNKIETEGDKLQEIVTKWDKAWKEMELDQQKLEVIRGLVYVYHNDYVESKPNVSLELKVLVSKVLEVLGDSSKQTNTEDEK